MWCDPLVFREARTKLFFAQLKTAPRAGTPDMQTKTCIKIKLLWINDLPGSLNFDMFMLNAAVGEQSYSYLNIFDVLYIKSPYIYYLGETEDCY